MSNLPDAGDEHLPPTSSLQRNLGFAGRAIGYTAREREHALAVLGPIETRLAHVMVGVQAATFKAAISIVSVGHEGDTSFAKVHEDVEAALRQTREELVSFFNECVPLRLRLVEFLNDLEVGALGVEQPVFKV